MQSTDDLSYFLLFSGINSQWRIVFSALDRNGLGAGVEGRGGFLGGLLPPGGDQPPPHSHELKVIAAVRDHCVNRRGGGNVVARLQIERRLRQLVERNDLAPGVLLRKAAAHAFCLSSYSQPIPRTVGKRRIWGAAFSFVAKSSSST